LKPYFKLWFEKSTFQNNILNDSFEISSQLIRKYTSRLQICVGMVCTRFA